MSDIRLMQGDCLEVMPTLADGSVDAVITDPPYGTTQLAFDQHPIDLRAMWHEINRCTKPDAVIVMFSAQPFTTDLINSNRKSFRYELIWCKTMGVGFLDVNRRPLRGHENMLLFSNGKMGTYNPQMETGHKPYRTLGRHGFTHYNPVANDSQERSSDDRRYPKSWIVDSNRNTPSEHPTQKPLSLMEWLVRTYSNPGDLVLDPFAGSGSTLVACVNTGRNGIGIELDEHYYSVASERVNAAQMQPHLFESTAVIGHLQKPDLPLSPLLSGMTDTELSGYPNGENGYSDKD